MKVFIVWAIAGAAVSFGYHAVTGHPICQPCHDLGARHAKIVSEWLHSEPEALPEPQAEVGEPT